jgi:hypothetical protein
MFKDFNEGRKIWVRKVLEPLAWFSADRGARLFNNLDTTVANFGFRQALQDLAGLFSHDIGVYGHENIPKEGPLVLLSNHPGTIDSAAIGAELPRDDLSIVATGFPLLQRLPAISQHLIFIDPHAVMNLSGTRSAIQHLRNGGALLIFPSGRIEPDPAIMPSAFEKLKYWSASIELFLKKVPETQVVITITSGVLSPIFLRNPFVHFLRDIRDPLAIAEVTQVLTQMIFKNRFRTHPKVSFGVPQSMDDLMVRSGDIYQTVIETAYQLMSEHLGMMYPESDPEPAYKGAYN